MSAQLTDAHHQWIVDVSGGAVDPRRFPPPVPQTAGATPANGAAPAADPTAVAAEKATFEKLAAIWHAAETKIHGDVGGLLAKLQGLYAGDSAATQMEKDFQVHFDKLSGTFDSSLAAELKEAAAASTDQELAKVKAEMRTRIGDFQKAIASDEAVSLMDENPFVDLSIAEFCGATLTKMLAAIA